MTSRTGLTRSNAYLVRSTRTTLAGVYFDDPDGHHLEAITARYDGSALT
jgi:hypothetical protein